MWMEFGACVVAIWFGGVRLSRYADAIAEKSGLGRNWTGMILLGTVTSLPELVTGVSSVTVAGVPDIAIGDVLGSTVFNLAILAVVEVITRPDSLYTRANRGHTLSAAFGSILIGIAALSLLATAQGAPVGIGHVGIYVPVIVLVYLVAMRLVHRYERHEMAEFVESATPRYDHISLRRALLGYAAAAAIVAAAGSWLPFIGDEIARALGWHTSFVGTLLIAAATSAPELAVTAATLRLGALDMAIASLLGSNLFDILIIAIDDLLYLPGPILADVSPAHVFSAISAMIMTGLAVVGLFYRPAGRLLHTMGWIGLSLVALYLTNAWLLFHFGG